MKDVDLQQSGNGGKCVARTRSFSFFLLHSIARTPLMTVTSIPGSSGCLKMIHKDPEQRM